MQMPMAHILIDDEGVARTIAGHVKVKMIAQKHFAGGENPEAIALHYEIELADVYAALAYYMDNKATFDAQEAANAQMMRQHGKSATVQLAEIRKRHQDDA